MVHFDCDTDGNIIYMSYPTFQSFLTWAGVWCAITPQKYVIGAIAVLEVRTYLLALHELRRSLSLDVSIQGHPPELLSIPEVDQLVKYLQTDTCFVLQHTISCSTASITSILVPQIARRGLFTIMTAMDLHDWLHSCNGWPYLLNLIPIFHLDQ